MADIPVKALSEIEVKAEVSDNDKILILDSESEEARLASKDELKGDKWDQWDKGDKWDKGETWPIWPKGEQWLQWPQGETWAKWDKWDKWDKGDTWAYWPTWPQWPKWDKWDKGDTWATGSKWDKGDKWDTGTAATVTVGTTTTWDAWTSASVTNSWTSSAAVLDFTIPKWAKGDQWVQWETWPAWADWNWITSVTSTKSWKTTTVTMNFDEWDPYSFQVQDWADWQGSGDMSASTYDPTSKMADAFDYTNMYNTPTAWANIKIASNKISANNMFIITEDDVTVSRTATKWVAPYNTNYYYTNIDIDANAGIEWREWAAYKFVIDTEIAATGSYRNVRVRIWEWEYIPVMNQANTILSWSTYFTKARNDFYIYKTVYESWWALHLEDWTNTTYSAMSVAEVDAWTSTSSRLLTAERLKYAVETWNKVQSVNWQTGDVVLSIPTDSDDLTEWSTNLFLTSAERTKLGNQSWTNTGDETASTIKTKLWITTLSGANTWDETTATIKTKLWAATSSADWYLTKEDFATFDWKQNALVSGTSIKTINNTSVLGSWDIAVQATISDLADIRSGAAAWATALQSGDNVSELNNDAWYLTSHQTLKTVNGNSLIGSGNVSVWTLTAETVVSGDSWVTYTIKKSTTAPSWAWSNTVTLVVE